MPRVDFYVLAEAGAPAQQRFACRLAEKACAEGLKGYFRTSTAAAAATLDELLWTFSDRTFLPHEVVREGADIHPATTFLIGTGPAPDGWRSLLVNLGDDVPADAADCERIAEVVDADADRKRLARDRFRRYRELGWLIESHTV